MNAADNMTSGESENNIPVIFENSKSDEFGTSISHGDYDWQPKYVRWNAVKTDILDQKFPQYKIQYIFEHACFFTPKTIKRVDEIQAKIKILMLIEPRDVIPHVYKKISQPAWFEKFDYILTFDTVLLRLDDRFIYTPYGGCWIHESDRIIHPKKKNISIISSNKNALIGHKLRQAIIHKFDHLLDTYGTGWHDKFIKCTDESFSGDSGHWYDTWERRSLPLGIKHKITGLRDYRYSVTVENSKIDDYFTEKLIDCIVTGTVPIYYGSPSIEDKFNIKGIIQFDRVEELQDIFDQCGKDDYNSRLDALEENIKLAKQYINYEDWMYTHLLKNL